MEIEEEIGEVASLGLGIWWRVGGATACHAEVVAVPVSLCVKIPQIPQRAEGMAHGGEGNEGREQRRGCEDELLKAAAYNRI